MTAAHPVRPAYREPESEEDLRICGKNSTVRVKYFYGMLLEAPDLELDQNFHLEARRRHHAELHGQGTVCGLYVGEGCDWEIHIAPGVAVDCLGRVIRVEESLTINVKEIVEAAFRDQVRQANEELGKYRKDPRDEFDHECWEDEIDLWVGLCYEECEERPVQSLGSPTTCCESICENSRVRHAYCVTVSTEEPEREPGITEGLDCDGYDLQAHLCRWITEKCRTCEPDPCGTDHHCITLAKISVLKNGDVKNPDNCSFRDLVISTQALAELVIGLDKTQKERKR